MQFSASLLLLGLSAASVDAFATRGQIANTRVRTVPVYATKQHNEDIIADALKSADATVKGALSGMAIAAALWAAPATMAGPLTSHLPRAVSGNDVVASSVASAKEMASGSGTRVNKDPESLLRYGLPINNKEVRMLDHTT